MNQGPFGTPFEEPEGAFPLLGPYVTVLHGQVTEYFCEHFALGRVIGGIEVDSRPGPGAGQGLYLSR